MKVPNSELPSIRADSINSFGIETKNPLKIKIDIGKPKTVYEIINESKLLYKPIFLIIINNREA